MVSCFMLDLIHVYENYLTKVKQASANTVASYMRDIRQFSDWLERNEHSDILDATQLNISAYLTYLQKQQHTAKRILDRLREEEGFDGSYSIVQRYVKSVRHAQQARATQELVWEPGSAQVDFGEADYVRLGPAESFRIRFQPEPAG